MQGEDIPDPLSAYEVLEREAVYLLTDPDRFQPIWSVEDIGRELEVENAIDVVRPLIRAGLVHRTSDGHVFATRAAVRMVQMVGQVV
jgi:hypothetical protein